MAKRFLILRLEDMTLQLRLTVAGQRELKERFGEDSLQTVAEAATDGERMAALLEAALNWKGSRNGIRSGEELYDRLVDEGWSGPARFGALAFDIGAASGLLEEAQAERLKRSMTAAVEDAFRTLGEEVEEEDAPRPTSPGE